MAIQKIKRKNDTVYRVVWRNPHTGKLEFGPRIESEKEANDENEKVLHRLKHEQDSFLPPDISPATNSPLMSGLLQEYLRHAHMTEATRTQTYYHIRRILDFMPSLEVADMKRSTLKQFERAMRDTGIKQNTVQRRVSIVLSCLNWAVDEEILEENPIQGYRCRRGEDLKLIPPTPQEVAAIHTHAPPHLRRALSLAWYLGVRPGASELFRLAWENVDLEARKIIVWSAKKNKEMQIRELDIVDALATLLVSWKHEDMASGSAWLIHYRGAPISSIKTAWSSVLERAGIERRIRPYDLRHSFATYSLAAGADIKAVAESMGHNSTAMIHKHYQHVLNKQKRQAMEAVPVLSIDPPAPPATIITEISDESPRWKN